MELLLVGLPGARFRWLHHHLQALAPSFIPAGAEALSTVPTDAPMMLRAAYHLDEAWADALRQGSARGIVVLEQPELAFDELRQQGVAPIDALRTLVATAMPFGALSGCDSVLMLDATDWGDTAATGRRILHHSGWDIAEDRAQVWLENFAATEPPQRQPVLDPQDAALLAPVLQPALHHAATGLRQPVVWPRGCLRWGDQPEEPAPRVVELTGWSRILVFGPYLPLPPGDWTMRTVLAFSPAAREARLTLELRGQEVIGRCRFTVERPGLFAAVMRVTIPSPHHALELQLRLDHGVIEGCLGIDHVGFIPQEPQNAQSVA